jgi:hypothetical protein
VKVAGDNASAVAAGIRAGQGVVVVHGVDYNDNGGTTWRAAGGSELAATVPAEATDPAACACCATSPPVVEAAPAGASTLPGVSPCGPRGRGAPPRPACPPG